MEKICVYVYIYIYIYVLLNHSAVHQKLITLQINYTSKKKKNKYKYILVAILKTLFKEHVQWIKASSFCAHTGPYVKAN